MSLFLLNYQCFTLLSSLLYHQELNLSFGEITEGAALVLAQAITDKPYMEKVDLNGTHHRLIKK